MTGLQEAEHALHLSLALFKWTDTFSCAEALYVPKAGVSERSLRPAKIPDGRNAGKGFAKLQMPELSLISIAIRVGRPAGIRGHFKTRYGEQKPFISAKISDDFGW